MLGIFKSKNKNTIIQTTNDVVGCIGKLPVQAEFIKYNVVSNQLANLDNWLQQAYAQLNRGEQAAKQKNIFNQMPLHHFISCATNEFKPIIGSIIASQDQCGRSYPFLLFRMLENPIAKEFQTTIPILYTHFFNNAELICKAHWDDTKVTELQQNINMLSRYTIPAVRRLALETVIDKLNQFSLADFKNGLAQQYPSLSLEAIIRTYFSTLSDLKNSGRINMKPPIGLRLPIPQSPEQESFVVFWVQLMESLLNIKNSRFQLFWNQAGEYHSPAMTLYFNSIPHTYSPQFVDQTSEQENLINIVQLAKQTHTIEDKIRFIMQENQLPLIKIIQRLSEMNT